MKSLFYPLLLATISTSSISYGDDWSQVAYPDFSESYGSFGTAFGPMFYSIDAVPYSIQHLVDVSIGAFSLGFSQVVGYSHWFYFELRESFAYGYTFYGTQNTGVNYARRFERGLFFDADARLFFPFRVAPAQRITLQPFMGFALHQASLKGKVDAEPATLSSILLMQRYLSPLFGLALGFNPSPKFALRASLSLHIPEGKRKLPNQARPEAANYQTLRVQRHGIGADLLALMRLTPDWTLTGELDYFTYTSFPGYVTPTDEPFFFHPHATSALSVRGGVSYQF